MFGWRRWGAVLVAAGICLGAQVPEDPVMKAKAQRAEGDLPPVPRTVTEPPPLPPPEQHVRDTKGGKGKAGKKAKAAPSKGKKGKAKASPGPAPKGKSGKSKKKGKG